MDQRIFLRFHSAKVVFLTIAVFLASGVEPDSWAGPIPTNKPAAYPNWWFERDVINRLSSSNTAPVWSASYPVADDYAAANLGQLKNIATAAVAELDAHLPGGAGQTLHTLVNSWTNPPASGITRNDYAGLNLGQLKAVAQPFYDRLIAVGYASNYPWTNPATPANDYAAANLGQVKNLFSFDLKSVDAAHDSDGDGLPDWWERYYFNGQIGIGPNADSDGDGLTNLQEYLYGTNPTDRFDPAEVYIEIIIGDQQIGAPNNFLSMPLGVHITNADGKSAAYRPVTISVTDGGGTLGFSNTSTATTQNLSAVADANGFVSFYYRNPAGFNVTSHIAVASGNSTTEAVFTETTPVNLNPVNNNFSAAISISSDNGMVEGSSVGANRETAEPNHTIYPSGASIWYKWTATTTGTVNFNTIGSSFDTICAAYSGNALTNLVLLTSNNDDARPDQWSMFSHVSFKAVQGHSYYIVVEGFKGQVGKVKLNWSRSAGPANDYFADAEGITGENGTDTVTFDGATSESGEPIHEGNYNGSSVWYRWVSPAGGTVKFDTTGSSFETFLGIYKGNSFGNLTDVVRNDDTLNAQVPTSSARFPISIGEVFYIALGGGQNQTGNATLNWQVTKYNDAFADARAINGSSGSEIENNLIATRESGEPLHAGNTGSASIWYRWQASSANPVTFDTIGSDFDTTLAIYTGSSVSTLTNIVSNDDSHGRTSKVSFTPISGQFYFVAVDGYGNSKGHVILNWNTGSSLQLRSTANGAQGYTISFPPPNPDVAVSARASRAMLNADECDEPAQPNYGEAGEIRYVDGVEEFATSRTINLGIKAKASDPDCSEEINIQHKIVTVNTPRARDLPGKLTLTLKSGNASSIEIKHNGSTYVLGTAIPVLETGHEGCGVHTWHYGEEPFEFIGKQKGTVVLEAKVDPDPDDGGDGQPTQILTITVNVIKLTYTLLPDKKYGISAKTSWPSQEATTREKKITVTSDPSQFADQVVIKVKEISSNPSPGYTLSENNKGTLTQDSTDKKVWKYEAFTENLSEKHPLTKKVVFMASIDDQELCPPFDFEVRTVFSWLAEPREHQHGPNTSPHLPTDDDFNKAWQYVKAKYKLKLSNLAKVYYIKTEENDGYTTVGDGLGKRYCRLGPSAFDGKRNSLYSENWLAATLIHENVHGGQPSKGLIEDFIYKKTHTPHDDDLEFEVPAYEEQLRRAEEVGLPSEDKEYLQNIIDTVISGGTVHDAINN